MISYRKKSRKKTIILSVMARKINIVSEVSLMSDGVEVSFVSYVPQRRDNGREV